MELHDVNGVVSILSSATFNVSILQSPLKHYLMPVPANATNIYYLNQHKHKAEYSENMLPSWGFNAYHASLRLDSFAWFLVFVQLVWLLKANGNNIHFERNIDWNVWESFFIIRYRWKGQFKKQNELQVDKQCLIFVDK